MSQRYDEKRSEDPSQETIGIPLFDIDAVFAIFCMAVTGGEFMYHFNWGDEKFAWQNLVFFIFASMFIITWGMRKFKLKKIKDLTNAEKATKLFGIILITGLLMGSQILIVFVYEVVFTITQFEIVLFYVNAAISEEMMFRAFVADAVFTALNKTNKFAAIFFSIIISSFTFMLSHLGVYGTNPRLLVSTLIGGIVLGFGAIYLKNLTGCILAHVIYNATISGIKVVTSMLQVEFGNFEISIGISVTLLLVALLIISWFGYNEIKAGTTKRRVVFYLLAMCFIALSIVMLAVPLANYLILTTILGGP